MSRLRIRLRDHVRQKTNADKAAKKNNQPLSSKAKMKLYRERLKGNPALYKAYRESEAARSRLYRASLSDRKKADQREKTRIRVQKWREKQKVKLGQKNEATVSKPKNSVKTREQKKTQQEKWRLSKQKQRANMTGQKKRRINEKRRAKYHEKKQIAITKKEMTSNTESKGLEDDGYKTTDSKRKAVYRAKQNLPKDPKKFAQLISKLSETASPRKRKALEEEGVFSPTLKKRHVDILKRFQKAMQNTKTKRSKFHLEQRRHIASIGRIITKSERKNFGFSWGFTYKASQIEGIWEKKKKKNALDEFATEQIQQYFKKSGVSTCLPDKKLVSAKTMEPRRILEKSLKQTYCNFREENPDCVLSFPKFVSLRPKSVKTMNKNHFNGCLCEYCANLEMKVNALKKTVPKLKVQESDFEINSRYDLLKMTLYSKQEVAKFHNRECIDRKCSKCGPKKMEDQVKSAFCRRRLTKSKTIEWSRWENQNYKDEHGIKKTRKMLRLKQGTVSTFLKELVDELVPYSLHIHDASWQYNQFNQLVTDVPHNWVVFCMDYAENYQCLYQDEAQSAHWSHDQATLFSIVVYSTCPSCDENMHESLVFVSSEKQHDSHAVHHYVTLANQHLLDTRGLKISREIHFSDGASSQFKSRTPFADVAHSVEDYGFPIEKHYFGSRHGKGPCDSEFGVVKRSVSMAVLSRQAVVRDAKEFYEYCSSKLKKPKVEQDNCCHNRRTFFYVDVQEIPSKHSRSDRINAKPVSQTRKQHAIKPSGESKVALSKRLLSCFCKFCVGEEGDKCSSVAHVDDWLPEGKVQQRKGSEVVEHESLKARKECPKAKRDYVTADNDQIEKNKAFGDPEPINEDKLILQCCNFNDLTKAVKKITIEDLPSVSAKNFCNTGCTVDNDSLPIVPEDIPLKPNSQLYPCTIYGDGNCLPRSASLLAYGSEDNFKEMRRRMVIELTRNEKYYLDKTMMEKGKQYNAQNDVPKTFAHFSNMFQGQKLTSNNVKTIFEKEVLEIRKSGAYMGLWQIACLANILKCPVVSVVPTYGTNTVREDMHRAFYPFIEEFHSNQPVFIMWTRLGGVQNLEEKDFTLNHFDVLMPLTDTGSIDTDLDEYVMDESFDLNDTAGSSILNIITNFMTNELTTENDVPENLITAFSTDELHGNDISVPPAPDNGNTQFSYATDTTICENNVMVNQQLQTEEPRSVKKVFN